MFRRVLIAIQSASEAGRLVGVTQRIAARDASILSLHVRTVDAESDDDGVERFDSAESIAGTVVRQARGLGFGAEAEVLTIDRDRLAGRAIADVALGWRADAIVMGSRRLSDVGAALHGSVSHDVMRLAPCPILIAGTRGTGAVRSILLAVDKTAASRASEAVAATLARDSGATVSVVHVPSALVFSAPALGGYYLPAPEEDPVAQGALERLTGAGVKAEVNGARLYPPIADAIARSAEAVNADLIVIGSRGLGDLAALVRGSVSHELLHATERSVLVTRDSS